MEEQNFVSFTKYYQQYKDKLDKKLNAEVNTIILVILLFFIHNSDFIITKKRIQIKNSVFNFQLHIQLSLINLP